MENFRQQLMRNPDKYPEFGAPRKAVEVISIESTSTTSSDDLVAPPHETRITNQPILVSSDEENDKSDTEPELIENPSQLKLDPLKPRRDNVKVNSQANFPKNKYPPGQTTAQHPIQIQMKSTAGIPIHVPSNRDILLQQNAPKDSDTLGETIHVPNFVDDNLSMTAGDAEKALKELMSGSMNDDVVDINAEDAVVEDFREGIKLLPHQIIGRQWMRDREDTSKKRAGGILADDMGLGKTIQTLTRIVEGRPKKSDRDEGWSAQTLVICPLALVRQWADEINKMAKGMVVVQHHGPSRTSDSAQFRKAHVVITTYDVVKSEHGSHYPSAKDESKNKTKKPKGSDSEEVYEKTAKTSRTRKSGKDALYQIKWWRVVLDEAHNIKNHKTKGAVACCDLQAKFRWCLTGTPMQNNVSELYSLIKFLRIKPLSDLTTFNEQIAKPVSTGRGANRAMKRLQVVLKSIMLRRTKDQQLNGKRLIELPPRHVEIVHCPFSVTERAFYEGLENRVESVLEKLVSGTGKSIYTSVLLLLLRLRQACNHPVLVAENYTTDMAAVEPKAAKGDQDEDEDDLATAFGQLGVTRKCKLCQVELSKKNTDSETTDHCLDCAALAAKAKAQQSDRPDSAKIRMVLKLLANIEERSGGEEKTIIFSQFTSMLDLIQPFLRDAGIRFVRYDGTMSKDERDESLRKIREKENIRVILISFKAGSTGLNLTACNNVILVDLWWNPALEDQAFDRAHRYGQKKVVNIFKLMIDNTVEEKILKLQDKKRELAKAALSGDKIKNMRLGMDDLLALFRPGGRDDDEED